MNLYNLFHHTAVRQPERPAIVEGEKTVSYRELDSIVSGIAKDLKVYGVLPGQRIGLRFGNSIACIAITYALWKLDAAVVPIDVAFKPDEVRRVCEHMQLSAMIDHGIPYPDAVSGMCPGIQTPYFLLPIHAAAPAETGIHIAFVRFTSGTTGERKGVVLSHERIRERIRAVNRVLEITPGDRILWILPMSHHFVSTIVLYLTYGAAIVLSGALWGRSMLEAINREHVTLLYASPFHYSLLAADSSGIGMDGVRLAVSTAIGLPMEVHERFYRRFSRPLAQAYGIIEIGLVCINTGNPSGKPASVGRVLPDYRLQIRNARAYSEDGNRECGELYFSGPGFFDAYLHPRIDSRRALSGAWFETGDIGGLDEEGYLYLHGRKNHVINTAGIKIFPVEIETVLNRHPAVKESCVYGKSHERYGQIVAAVVVPDKTGDPAGEDALRAFCRKALADYKVPEQIDFTDSIEKTPSTGKIKRPSPSRNR